MRGLGIWFFCSLLNEHFSICCSVLRRELGITLTLVRGWLVSLFALIMLCAVSYSVLEPVS